MIQFFTVGLMYLLAVPALPNNFETCAEEAISRGPFDITKPEDWANIAILCHKSLNSAPVDCAIDGIARINLGEISDWAHIAKLCSGAKSNKPIDCAIDAMRGLDAGKSESWSIVIKKCATKFR